jgi:hypothetical protein
VFSDSWVGAGERRWRFCGCCFFSPPSWLLAVTALLPLSDRDAHAVLHTSPFHATIVTAILQSRTILGRKGKRSETDARDESHLILALTRKI